MSIAFPRITAPARLLHPYGAMQPPPIQGLSAELVPHRQFPTRRWFYANPVWYYHRPDPLPRLKLDPGFYKLVDSELRDVCRLLHQAGLTTTPSCHGHFHRRGYFQCVWNELKREERAIRSPAGLVVRNSETDEPHLFQDRSYNLPWSDFARFYEEVAAQQHVGYLGMLVPPQRQALHDSLQKDAYSTSQTSLELDEPLSHGLGGFLFGVSIAADNPEQRHREWQHFTDYVHCLLRQHPLA